MAFVRQQNKLYTYLAVCYLVAGSVSLCLAQSAAKNAASPPKTQILAKALDKGFVTARGIELWRGKYELNNIGVNVQDLFLRYLTGDAASAKLDLTRASAFGVRFVRCGSGIHGTADFKRYSEDRATWYAAFRHMLSDADASGIGIVHVLLPDLSVLASLGQAPTAQAALRQGSPQNSAAVAYASGMASEFRDDARLLFWEIGDEYNRDADLEDASIALKCSSDAVRQFLIQIARTIHAADRHHLVSSGCGDVRPDSWHLRQTALYHKSSGASAPDNIVGDTGAMDSFEQYAEMIRFYAPSPIDIVSVHLNPPGESKVKWLIEDDEHAFRLPWIRQAASAFPSNPQGSVLGKPLFVGAFGQDWQSGAKSVEPAWTLDLLKRARSDAGPVLALRQSATIPPSPTAQQKLQEVPIEVMNQIMNLNQLMLSAARDSPYIK